MKASETPPMTDLDKLETLAKAATPGEWVTRYPSHTVVMAVTPDGTYQGEVARTVSGSLNAQREANAAFIAAANPVTILDLVEEIESLIGYAVHDDACTTNRFPGQDVCSCGLSSLLQRIRHQREARAAHTGEG